MRSLFYNKGGQIKPVVVMLFFSLFTNACSDKQDSEQNKVDPQQDSKWVSQAKKLTVQHKLVSHEIECLSFYEDEAVNGKIAITIREKHNEKYGGDLQTAPRLFSFEVDVATGEYKTDRYSIVTGGDYESMDKLSRHLLEE